MFVCLFVCLSVETLSMSSADTQRREAPLGLAGSGFIKTVRTAKLPKKYDYYYSTLVIELNFCPLHEKNLLVKDRCSPCSAVHKSQLHSLSHSPSPFFLTMDLACSLDGYQRC